MTASRRTGPTRPGAATRNRPAEQIVSPDALALVRFGLRAAHDPSILDTVKVIDAELRRELPQGPVWYRYNGDGYGEHADGEPFDGMGEGRLTAASEGAASIA